MSLVVPARELAALEADVQAALAAGDQGSLDVLGYGEVTLVLHLDTGHGSFACKRLPVFPDRKRLDRYRSSLDTYLRLLTERGLHVAETAMWHLTLPDGRVVAYCLQEALPSKRLCSSLLHSEGEQWADDFFSRFLDHVEQTVTPTLGLDAQASNWIDLDGRLHYLDVTTPMLRDAHGAELLDVRLFFTSLPWLLRDPVRLAVGSSIFDKFYDVRGVVLDFLGNLIKEDLDALIPRFVEQANARLKEPLTADEVAAYYRGDARMWELIQRLRKADRFWQRRVRRRVYPFLLPPVDRR